MPLVSFYTRGFLIFQGVYKEISFMKWFSGNFLEINSLPYSKRKSIAPCIRFGKIFKSLSVVIFVDLLDLNLLDWGSNGLIAVPLYNAIYLWNSDTGSVEELFGENYQLPAETTVTSVKWISEGSHLAVGLSSGAVEVSELNSQPYNNLNEVMVDIRHCFKHFYDVESDLL